jgi:predicted RecB family endonuclease
MSLGPSGFLFEQFFSEILKNYGYKTKINVFLKGKIITHEIDIIAEKNKKYMIECKLS